MHLEELSRTNTVNASYNHAAEIKSLQTQKSFSLILSNPLNVSVESSAPVSTLVCFQYPANVFSLIQPLCHVFEAQIAKVPKSCKLGIFSDLGFWLFRQHPEIRIHPYESQKFSNLGTTVSLSYISLHCIYPYETSGWVSKDA